MLRVCHRENMNGTAKGRKWMISGCPSLNNISPIQTFKGTGHVRGVWRMTDVWSVSDRCVESDGCVECE